MAEAIISRRGGGLKIVSLQRGIRDRAGGTQSIAPVDMNKAILICNQANGADSVMLEHYNVGGWAILEPSGDTITFGGFRNSYRMFYSWQVIEIAGAKSIQRGFASSTANITISPVDMTRAILVVNKNSGSRENYLDFNLGFSVYLADESTISFNGHGSVRNIGFYWQLIEF